MEKKISTKNLVIAGLLTAIGVAMPSLFHTIHLAGNIFLPMHIPVLLCGFLCGPLLGGICGFIVPFICGMITGMPPLFPVATYMAFELLGYGVLTGILGKKMNTYIALIISMLGGRAILGVAQAICLGIAGKTFAFKAFLTGAFVTAWPGILIQIILVPVLIMALKKAKVISKN